MTSLTHGFLCHAMLNVSLNGYDEEDEEIEGEKCKSAVEDHL